MRDTKLINAYVVKQNKDKKQKELFKVLKKEVETGANGTQNYISINKFSISHSINYSLVLTNYFF